MIDLFGLSHKEPSPHKDEPEVPTPQVPRGSHRLWAFLLVLDSLFVIVFAGAVAASVYHYWKSPAPSLTNKRPSKSPEVVKTAVPVVSTAPVAAQAKSPEPSSPSPKQPIAAPRPNDGPRPPKPSLLTDAPKPRSTPAPTGAVASAPAKTPEAPKMESSADKAVDNKKAMPVIFKLHAPEASSVQLIGAFIVHGGRKEMSTDSEGLWSVKLYLNPGQYRYFFSVDKKKMLDPENPNSDRGASIITVP
jgi:cytoskeletal protein RodZ